jgi:transcription elongation factor Elf1
VLGEEFIDGYWIKCYRCGHRMPSNVDYEIYEEGNHYIPCSSCGMEFEVETTVSYTFISQGAPVEEEEE